MIDEELKTKLLGLRYEIIDLNQSSHFFVSKMNRMGHVLRETGREFFLEELFALRYLENGIILHLTNLDDNKSRYSFWAAQKLMNSKSRDYKQNDLMNISKQIKSFRRNVNHLKTRHRNSRIAHINSTVFPELDQFLSFDAVVKPLIEEANKIADMMWGEEISVKFKIGSHEGILDFRQKNQSSYIDINLVNQF